MGEWLEHKWLKWQIVAEMLRRFLEESTIGRQSMGCSEAQASPQNDIADVIGRLIALLQRIADFFNSLSQPRTQALGACEAAFLDSVKAELLTVLQRLPAHVQNYIACKIGAAPVAPQAVETQAGFGDFLKIMQFLQQIAQYLPQLLALLKQLGSMIPTTPPVVPPPVAPSGFNPASVNRCS